MSFDAYARDYDQVLNSALAASGEQKEYFASERIAWLRKQMHRLGFAPLSVIDYGCGTGSSTPYFVYLPSIVSVIGVDTSAESIRQARQKHPFAHARFLTCADYCPSGEFDLAFCNGVFHHIAPDQRFAAVRYIYHALRPGGLFAFWENNPWNPGARYIMARCEFDRDAIQLSPLAARSLLRCGGFRVLRITSRFYFPRALKWLRRLEPALAPIPLGGQYLILCQKPDTQTSHIAISNGKARLD
jgi:SAM-dependent methyltransferase